MKSKTILLLFLYSFFYTGNAQTSTLELKADSLFTSGFDLYKKRDFKNSWEAYQQYLQIRPTDQNGLYNRGICSYAMLDYKDAIVDYNKSIEYGRRQYDVYYNRGICLYMLGNYQQSLPDFDTAISLKADGLSFIYKGAALHYLKKYKEAESNLSTGILIMPNCEQAYYFRCMARYNLGNFKGSMDDCLEALKLKKDYDVLFWQGMNNIALNNYPAGIADYDTVLKNKPNDPLAFYNRGIAYYELKAYQKALADENLSIHFNPGNADAYYMRAICYFELKDYKTAENDFNSSATLGNQDSKLYCWRGANFYQMGNFDKAKENLQKALNADPNSTSASYFLILTLLKVKDYANCISQCNTYLTKYKSPLILCCRGSAKSESGDFTNAVTDLNNCLISQPDFTPAISALGRNLFLENKYDDALPYFDKAIQLKSDDGQVWFYRAQTYQAQKQYAKACVNFKKSYELKYQEALQELKKMGCR